MGRWNFLGFNRLGAPPAPHSVGEPSRKISKNHLIPTLELVKYYRATFITIGPTRALTLLIEDGLIEFSRIKLARLVPHSLGEPPQKAPKSPNFCFGVRKMLPGNIYY